MEIVSYMPHLSFGSRVLLTGINHPKNGQECTIIRILPNPSRNADHQWYDVRFDDCSTGRFLERHLLPAHADNRMPAA